MVIGIRAWGLVGSVVVAVVTAPLALADDPIKKPDAPAKPRRSLDETPARFVPLHPRTTEDQNRVEALRLYAAARALEDQFLIGGPKRDRDLKKPVGDAIALLEKAQKLDPKSTPILRRLAKLNLVAGKIDAGVANARAILELDPGDTAALALLVSHHLDRKNDAVGAENELRKIAANPKLDKASMGYLLLHRDLGDLNSDLNRQERAADAYAKLIEALDARGSKPLPGSIQKKLFEDDESIAYLRYGETFLRANRIEEAIRAFRRGLLFRADHPVLPRLLAEALLKSGKPDEALATLEPFLKRQPAGNEPYDLLIEILTKLGRQKDILPKLEEAGQDDPNNLRLQITLSDQYRAAGEVEKADALLERLRKNQADPQIFAILANSYLKAKKTEELVRILSEVYARTNGPEAINTQIITLAKDADQVDRALALGVKLVTARPPDLGDDMRKVLRLVAVQATRFDKLIEIDRQSFANTPTSSNQKELIEDLGFAGKYADADAAYKVLFEKFPTERDPTNLLNQANVRLFAGKPDEAVAIGREAEKIDPMDPEVQYALGQLLSRCGRDDEAIAAFQALLKRFPDNKRLVYLVRSSLSNFFLNKGDNAHAEAELEVLLQQDPDDAGVNNDLGYLLADQGKSLERAENMIRKALDEKPDDAAYLDSLAWVLFKRGKVQEAVEPLQKALKSDRVDSTICEHMADVYFRLKDYAQAKDFYKKAEAISAKMTPVDRRLPEIRKKLADLEELGVKPGASPSEKP